MRKCNGFFLILFLLITLFADSKPPRLTPKDAKAKLQEIFKAHATHKEMSPELVKRALENFLNELDPLKTYLIEDEIDKWIHPSNELIDRTLQGYLSGDFSEFLTIHQVMTNAIKRRSLLEEKTGQMPLPTDVQSSEFKDLEWARSEEELLTRLLRIRAAQASAADKLHQETKQQFLQRLTKYRLAREEEITGKQFSDATAIVLSHVLKATTSALDSQTVYFTPSEANQFMQQVQQRLFGIGAQLRDDLSGFTIVRLIEGGPAILDGKIKPGDRIIAVNGEPVVGLDITEAVEKIRGPEGTQVHLTILRTSSEGENKEEEKHDIDLIRGEVVLKETRLETSYEPYGDGVIGIFHLFSFYMDPNSSSSNDLYQAIEKLKAEHHLKGIVLDLRSNAGGHLTQAVAVTGLFIQNGVVVSVKDNTGEIQRLRNFNGKMAWDGPMIVLTNRASASASEIVAQALQDYGRALVVGDSHSFGKGTFQIFSLESGRSEKVNPQGEYKVTCGKYYTVSGKTPQCVGVGADIVMPGILSEMEIGEKFSKFPLENDMIPASFQDDLSDVPVIHRFHIQKAYQSQQQPVLSTYQPYLNILKSNSASRIELNKNYQAFIKAAQQSDPSIEPAESFGQNDLQLDETLNIMKDVIILMQPVAKAA